MHCTCCFATEVTILPHAFFSLSVQKCVYLTPNDILVHHSQESLQLQVNKEQTRKQKFSGTSHNRPSRDEWIHFVPLLDRHAIPREFELHVSPVFQTDSNFMKNFPWANVTFVPLVCRITVENAMWSRRPSCISDCWCAQTPRREVRRSPICPANQGHSCTTNLQ